MFGKLSQTLSSFAHQRRQANLDEMFERAIKKTEAEADKYVAVKAGRSFTRQIDNKTEELGKQSNE